MAKKSDMPTTNPSPAPISNPKLKVVSPSFLSKQMTPDLGGSKSKSKLGTPSKSPRLKK